ncbi:hypothetical protein FCM35_KLT21689 [Carex littledalei]|uniref:TOD1/MUCI70 glycosyltransferase-like domain-containing protein n=1 Tax=Carex littledalei TaxID=544730 RepID=A0A833VNW4_9POAL|nr:hypothetical protein FCM35_KLT21689 [Carex littledalei]
MSGSSLGLRSASYGSLQQQLQNGAGLAQLQIQISPVSVPVSVRKTPSKMALQGSRDKERVLNRICKVAGRRRVGMFLLLLVSAVVFCSLFSFITKDDDTTPGIESSMGLSNHNTNTIAVREEISLNTRTTPAVPSPHVKLNIMFPAPISDSSQMFTEHPCANFSFMPPPISPKRTGPRPCPVCYASVEQAMSLIPVEPSASPVLNTLDFISDENLVERETLNGGSSFGGYPSLLDRDLSYDIRDSMRVHCGFVKGRRPGQGTGFDIDESDLSAMENCFGVVVASAIFGNYDILQQPKNVSEQAKQNVCFFMFVDEETEAYMKNYTTIDENKYVGLWRIVVVRNLPYRDARRNGKVPKLLLHRLFPNVRYSIWIDGKLELVRDPYQILERFLWRKNVTLAISRHYRRFDVYEEAEANKAAGKYDNSSIDNQIEFYRREGLTHYSSAKLPFTSDVPEGCVIIKEHIPITNLFTCLWFNEVDRFTARDQLSFSTVRDKIRSKVGWYPDMFLDCERRDFVVQAYHRELLEQRQRALKNRQPPALTEAPYMKPATNEAHYTRNPPRKLAPVKRPKDRKSGSKRHRQKATNSFL